MKHKLIICTLVAAFAISKTTFAQSSVQGSNAAASNTIILEGLKFPMTASEYEAAKQKLAQQKKNTEAPELKQDVAPALKVTAITNEELQNLNKTNKQPTSVIPSAKPAASGEYADKTIPGTLLATPVINIGTPTGVQPAAVPANSKPEVKQQENN